jgi:hypothetical protein
VLRFTVDGKGNITVGTLDYNREEVYEGIQSTALTGSYTVAKDGRTALTIQTSSPSLNASTGPFVFSTTLRSDGNMALMPYGAGGCRYRGEAERHHQHEHVCGGLCAGVHRYGLFPGYYLGGTAAPGRIVSNGNGSVTSGTLDQNKGYSVSRRSVGERYVQH